MKRYLKSITLLALIAALLMGCNMAPDTPDAGTGTDKTMVARNQNFFCHAVSFCGQGA